MGWHVCSGGKLLLWSEFVKRQRQQQKSSSNFSLAGRLARHSSLSSTFDTLKKKLKIICAIWFDDVALGPRQQNHLMIIYCFRWINLQKCPWFNSSLFAFRPRCSRPAISFHWQSVRQLDRGERDWNNEIDFFLSHSVTLSACTAERTIFDLVCSPRLCRFVSVRRCRSNNNSRLKSAIHNANDNVEIEIFINLSIWAEMSDVMDAISDLIDNASKSCWFYLPV